LKEEGNEEWEKKGQRKLGMLSTEQKERLKKKKKRKKKMWLPF